MFSQCGNLSREFDVLQKIQAWKMHGIHVKLIEQLGKLFSLVNLGELRWLLGIAIT